MRKMQIEKVRERGVGIIEIVRKRGKISEIVREKEKCKWEIKTKIETDSIGQKE